MEPLWLPPMYCTRCDVLWESTFDPCWICKQPGEHQKRLVSPETRMETARD